jgi:hypothetical protein
MFEAMAAGRPLLLAARGEAAELEAVGLRRPEDHQALVDAITGLQADGRANLVRLGAPVVPRQRNMTWIRLFTPGGLC